MKFRYLFNFLEEITQNDASGHDFWHVMRVYKMAKHLLEQTPEADTDVVLAAALLHDSYDDKLVHSVEEAKKRAEDVLETAGMPEEKRLLVFDIIDHMSFKKNLEQKQKLSLEGQLVQDADRLDALGAIGIARAMMYGATHHSPLYDPNVTPRTALTATSYREENGTIINHFHEKLLHLESSMNTKAGRALAEKRTEVMRDYLDEFILEWNGER